MNKGLVLDPRELKEIHHCIYYRRFLAHGTVGHNVLIIAAKVCETLGFDLNQNNQLTFQGMVLDDTVPSLEVTAEVKLSDQ